MATDAQGRPLSDDGNYYWDGSDWQLVDQSAVPGGDGSPSVRSASVDAQGRQLSDDGNYYWDGSSWQPVGQSVASGGDGSGGAGGAGGDGLQELTVSVVLHAVGEMTLHAVGALLALVIDVVSIPGDVALKPVDPPPSNPVKTGPFIAACAFDGHSIIMDEPGSTVLNNGMWVWNTTFDSQSDAQAKAAEHGANFCPDNGQRAGVLAVSELSG